MYVHTSRFGSVRVEAEDVFTFSAGLIGLEDCQKWLLLGDADNQAVGWLQSCTQPEVAVAVVSPRRFLPDYRVRVSSADLAALELADSDRAFVLNIVSRHGDALTINLKAPVLLNLDRRIGRQIVTSDDQPLQWALSQVAPVRKTA